MQDWVSQPTKWYPIQSQREEKWGTKKQERAGVLEIGAPGGQWHRNGKVWRPVVKSKGQLEFKHYIERWRWTSHSEFGLYEDWTCQEGRLYFVEWRQSTFWLCFCSHFIIFYIDFNSLILPGVNKFGL